MKELNTLLGELGISKVKLAKYLGVSRQMIYNYLELASLSKWPQEKRIIIFLIKEKFTEEKNKDTYYTFLYLYHVLQSLDNVKEIKYIFAYLSKKTGFTSPNEFKFDETKQFILESIIFTAFNLYNNGGASKSKLVDSHNRFVQEIENDKEEKLSRTQQLNTVKLQALRELGYTEINKDNASEVLNRMAEIQSRKM